MIQGTLNLVLGDIGNIIATSFIVLATSVIYVCKCQLSPEEAAAEDEASQTQPEHTGTVAVDHETESSQEVVPLPALEQVPPTIDLKEARVEEEPVQQELTPPARPRLYFLDTLKIFLTFIVLEHHIACAFGGCGEGSWFLIIGEYSNPFQYVARSFATMNQAYFMPLFFFVSAYFTPSSYQRRTKAEFLDKHKVRVYIPAMVATFTVVPVCCMIGQFMAGITIVYLPRSGHCWFLLWLLIFNWAYCCIGDRLKKRNHEEGEAPDRPTSTPFPRLQKRLFYGFLVCGLLMFAVVVALGGGGSFFTMPITIGSLMCDIVFFAAGTQAKANNWLAPENLRSKLECSIWYQRALVLVEGGLMLFLLFMAEEEMEVLYIPMFLVAGVYCIDMSLVLLDFFQINVNYRNAFIGALADAAYGVYILHPLVITGATAAFLKIYNNLHQDNPLQFEDESVVSKTQLQGPGDGSLHLLAGFLILSVVCNLVCWPLAWWIRQLPGFRRSL
ncbi:acyltransferase 3 [Seminavis robusta]|uniref:Acyltransferase 3 n=1 Tax=Seminavis robusta TaxID=568900 RepID=A0A9N8EB31_9STRA|nr:acyltransferase 3 [Seminavis robusta]|eukprot:Sro885_g216160.1 acyltransferase 3 (500) ;mRNA; r:39875-41374